MDEEELNGGKKKKREGRKALGAQFFLVGATFQQHTFLWQIALPIHIKNH
jgi:hypothetical protein